jgi:CubicO group peptidase (beta-lactamase class C family)
LKQILIISFFFWFTTKAVSQYYFPPDNQTVWDTLSPSVLGWCNSETEKLYQFLNANNTKAFILLKEGKIVLEKYFNGHSAAANWYWASAGKTLTAFVVGIAQQEKLLNINDKSSDYLGKGWTNCSPEQENEITIRHQLTMTSGLDDGVSDPYCTNGSCLKFKAKAGNRWAYHNAPYTLLDKVIEKASGQSLNVYTTQKVRTQTGMNGLFIQQDFNNVFFSTARSMARFGLLIF